MKKALTKTQQKAYDKILEKTKRYPQYFKDNKEGMTFNHSVLNSWRDKPTAYGIPMRDLESLEKKGYIKLFKNKFTDNGVFNPVADSWGYSSYSVETTATLIKE